MWKNGKNFIENGSRTRDLRTVEMQFIFSLLRELEVILWGVINEKVECVMHSGNGFCGNVFCYH